MNKYIGFGDTYLLMAAEMLMKKKNRVDLLNFFPLKVFKKGNAKTQFDNGRPIDKPSSNFRILTEL